MDHLDLVRTSEHKWRAKLLKWSELVSNCPSKCQHKCLFTCLKPIRETCFSLTTTAANVWMVNLCLELNFWWLERVPDQRLGLQHKLCSNDFRFAKANVLIGKLNGE